MTTGRARLRAALVVLVLAGSASCEGKPAPGPPADAPGARGDGPTPLPDHDPALAKRLVREGAVLIDVRTQEEFDGGHVEGAHLIPVQELAQRMGQVESLAGGDKDKPIVLYCRSGARAARAKQMLLQAGYRQVTNLGGVGDWPGG